MAKQVIIIGAGPAGLTAALELLRRSHIKPIVLEALEQAGGISRTIEYKGNRMDIGGHRFFSKSDWVMDWWREILPVARRPGCTQDELVGYVPPEERVMLVRSRLSRIYFLRKFFDYPISLSGQTIRNLGPVRLVRIGLAYMIARAFPRKPEKNLEDFFINRFGAELYRTFFKDYTEKVWGVQCRDINPEWGAQRIKGLSVTRALVHAARKMLPKRDRGVAQKGTETSLIERFLYPKYGPGQMWQVVAGMVREGGGQVLYGLDVRKLRKDGNRVVAVEATDRITGETRSFPCDDVISTMPVRDLILGMEPPAPAQVRRVAEGLAYRDFITIGVLVKKLKAGKYTAAGSPNNLVPDTWIYIQEPDVKIGRLQIFNNWSPALVRDPGTVWLGLEYFCREGDELWRMEDEALARLAIGELARIDLIEADDALDSNVVRVPKAYPAYFGTYDEFRVIREFTDSVANLYLVGRNGMHRYNNQDHSMLTAKLAAECILAGGRGKEAIWAVNVDDEYHEEKKPG